MPDDIYTKNPIVRRSSEHVLLNAIGGRLESDDLIDKATNDVLGHDIDAPLTNAILPIRVMLGALSGDGDAPPAYKQAVTDDGDKYNLLSSGKPELGKPDIKIEHGADGKLKISGRARSKSELRQLTRRTLEKHGVPFAALDAVAEKVEEHVPWLHVGIEITPEALRCIAKMACNLLAYADRDFFLSTPFDPVRSFVKNGGNTEQFVAYNTLPVDIGENGRALGGLDHLVLVKVNHKSGAAEALVVVYRHLQFLVRLASGNLGRSVKTSYRVDQLDRRQRHDDYQDASLKIPKFEKVATANWAIKRDVIHGAMNRILRVVAVRQESLLIKEMVEATWEKVNGPKSGRVITEAMIERFSEAFAQAYVERLQRIGRLDDVVADLERRGLLK